MSEIKFSFELLPCNTNSQWIQFDVGLKGWFWLLLVCTIFNKTWKMKQALEQQLVQEPTGHSLFIFGRWAFFTVSVKFGFVWIGSSIYILIDGFNEKLVKFDFFLYLKCLLTNIKIILHTGRKKWIFNYFSIIINRWQNNKKKIRKSLDVVLRRKGI